MKNCILKFLKGVWGVGLRRERQPNGVGCEGIQIKCVTADQRPLIPLAKIPRILFTSVR